MMKKRLRFLLLYGSTQEAIVLQAQQKGGSAVINPGYLHPNDVPGKNHLIVYNTHAGSNNYILRSIIEAGLHKNIFPVKTGIGQKCQCGTGNGILN